MSATFSMARYITVAFLCTRCLLVSNTPSFWDNFLPIPIETKKASEDVIRSGSEDLPVLDYQSPGSEYGLIHNVFGTNRRARKLSQSSSWNKNDVWLEDGNLLVLKGGVLNGNTNRSYVRLFDLWSCLWIFWSRLQCRPNCN